MEGLQEAGLPSKNHIERLRSLLYAKKIERIGAGPGTRYVLAGYVEEKEEEEDQEIEEELGIGEPQDEEPEPETKPLPKPETESAHEEVDIEELCVFLKSKIGKEKPTSYEEFENFWENATDLWAQLVDNASPLRKKIDAELGFRILIWETRNGIMIDRK
jgi:hypothetical protein